MADLSRDEFQFQVGLIRGDIKGVHERLDALNGRTRQNEEAIAVLEDRSNQATKDSAARYTGIGAVVASAGTFLWQWFHKG